MTSPITNLFAFRYTNEISVALGLATIWPIALLSLPIIFSPIIAFVFNDNPETNVNPSKVGLDVSFDS